MDGEAAAALVACGDRGAGRHSRHAGRGRAWTGTTDSSDGPVWAYDNLERTITATPAGPSVWNVTINSQGSYKAFADPRTGTAWDGNGPVSGWVTYQVTSPNTPDVRNLSGQSDPALHSGDLIVQMFGGQAQVTGLHYAFTYQLHGQPYAQNG